MDNARQYKMPTGDYLTVRPAVWGTNVTCEAQGCTKPYRVLLDACYCAKHFLDAARVIERAGEELANE